MSRLAVVESLCQTKYTGCASCCGIYNYTDRNLPTFRTRIQKRTHEVEDCHFDIEELTKLRDRVLHEERGLILTDAIKTCPFAGFIDDERLGCLIHPRRHPDEKDIRDIAVYPREVCDGHHCAPHTWLSKPERAFISQCTTVFYGQLVADTGMVKALVRRIEAHLGKALGIHDVELSADEINALFDILEKWPGRSENPRRFGAYILDENAGERRLGALQDRMQNVLQKTFDDSAAKSLALILVALSTDDGADMSRWNAWAADIDAGCAQIAAACSRAIPTT